MSALEAAINWQVVRQEKLIRKEARREFCSSQGGLLEDLPDYPSSQSGVLLVFDQQNKILAAWCGVYIREDSRQRLQRGFPLALRTPCGTPALFQRPGYVMVVSAKRLSEFERDLGRRCAQVPRSYLESLSQSEHNRPWLRLSQEEKLVTLDHVIGLFRIRRTA